MSKKKKCFKIKLHSKKERFQTSDISKRCCLILQRFKLGRRGFSFNTSRSLLSYMQQLSGRIIEEEMTIFLKKSCYAKDRVPQFV